jgi:hypothetical protein
VTILIRLILYISYIAPPSSLPFGSLPTPLKAIARGFLVLFHIGIWNLSTIFHHLNLLPSLSPLLLVPFPQHYTYFIVVVFDTNLSRCSKGCLNVCPLWVCFTLVRSTPSITLPYLFTSHPPFFIIFQYISLYPLPSYLMFMILLLLYHSIFLSLFSWVPKSSSTVTDVFYIWVCVWSCLFLCTFLSLDLSSMSERKHVALVFLILAYFT